MSKLIQIYGATSPKTAFLNPAIDWSLRNNTQGYNGAYIRVRRLSDNEETNILGVNNQLDIANMLAWAGSDIRIVRIYNKGFFGSGFDFVQTDANRQPFIVRNGDLVTVNSKVAIDFSGGNFRLRTAQNHATGILDNNSVLSAVFESQANGGSTTLADLGGVVEERSNATASQRIAIFSDTRSVFFRHSNYSPDGTLRQPSFPNQQPTSTQRQLSYKREGNLVESHAENQFVDSLSSTAQFSAASKFFNLGWQEAGALHFNGKWQETLIDTDPVKRALIDTNQMNYYGI